jgi:hypothetical protein
MIIHLVLFNPKPGLSDAQSRLFAQSVGEAFRSIDCIERVRLGPRISVDPGYVRLFGDKTYQFVAILEFPDRAALVAYLQHPRHQVLGRLFWEACESTIVSEHEMVDGRSAELEQLLFR